MADEVKEPITSIQTGSHAVEATKPTVATRVREWLAGTESSEENLDDNPPRSRKRAREPTLESWSTAKRPRLSEEAREQDQINYLKPGYGLDRGFRSTTCPGPSYDSTDAHQTNPRKRGRELDLPNQSPAKRPRISDSTANPRIPIYDTQPLFTPANEQPFVPPCSVCSEALLDAIADDVDLPSFDIPSAADNPTRTDNPIGTESLEAPQNALNEQSDDPVMGEWWLNPPELQFDDLFLCEAWPNCGGPRNCQHCRWDF